ncbi:Vomp family autotransporter [Bartonella gliris]|uniref:Vomp family autotransporter n=1 Tax=Bartonella gliris TaxID=3004109 RepID=UPI00387316D1
MKKLHSTPNFIKAVSLGTAMAALLSSVSPVFAANLAITGATVQSSNMPSVSYQKGSHGSIVLTGDDDYCGVDNVVGRGGSTQSSNNSITAEEQYNRFIEDRKFHDRNPYGTTTEKVTWLADGATDPRGGYMGTAITNGLMNVMPEAYGVYSFATGCGSSATGNYSTAFGAGATTKAGGAQAFGVSALASGRASVAMGVGSEAKEKSTVAIGGLATALGENSVALGTRTRAEKNYAIAIGSEAEAQGSGSIAIGSRRSDRTEASNPERKVTAKGENAIAIGTHTYAETADSVAIGANAQVTVFDGVAIGGGSVSDRDKGVVGYDPYLDGDATETGMAWKSTTGAFSVGEVGGRGNGNLTRQITGVAAGSKDTDAVNVAQLKAMKDLVAGEWKLSIDGKNETPVKGGSIVDFSVKNDNAVGQDNLKIEKDNADNNKHKVTFALSDNLKLTSVTTGNSSLKSDGLVITGGPSVQSEGINAGGKKITGVLEGTDNTDAVNYKQLQDIKDLVTEGGGWKLAVDGEGATDVKAGSTVDFVAVKDKENNKNIKIVKGDGNKVTFDLGDNIRVTSVTAGRSTVSDDGFIFANGAKITVDGINAGGKKITGVLAGTESTDAVNYKQLQDIKDLVTEGGGWKLAVEDGKPTNIGAESTVKFVAAADKDSHKNINIVKDDDNEVTFDLNKFIKVNKIKVGDEVTITDNGLVIKRGPSITYGGIDAGSKEIKNVAEGILPFDAVNLNQLEKVKEKIQEVADNSLVKWDEDEKLITIGAKKDGEIINVKNNTDNERVITGVADGGVDENSADAINGSQLYSIGSKIAKYFGGGASFENGDFTGPEYELTTIEEDGTVSIKNYPDVGSALDVVNKNVFAVDHRITVGFLDIADYFGGGAKYEKGEWKAPTFKVSQRDADGTIVEKEHHNVADAFGGVDKSITDIYNQINNVTGNGLVKWDKDQKLITIGAEKDGTKIDIAGSEGDRIITGVKAAVEDNDAVNKKQLEDTITEVADSIKFNILVKQDKEDGPITVGKERGGTTINIANKSGDARTISGVKAAVEDNEAVNKAQLDGTIVDINDKINVIKEASAFAVLYDKDKDGAVNYDSVTLGGSKSKGQVALLNVKDGKINKDSHDAINGSQIDKISQDVAKFFGGSAAFENGAFVGPRYNLTTIDKDSKEKQKEYNDVGSALTGLDTNIRNVNHHLIHAIKDVATYFGGGAGYDDKEEWRAPTFQVIEFNADGTSAKKPYYNVADAFEGVNNSFTNIHNQISNITKNSLVKQEGGTEGIITIGKATGGTKISIADKSGNARTISGVKAAEKGDEAVNKNQLDKSIKEANAAAVLYDKNEDGSINYGSVTLGGGQGEGPVVLLNVKDGRIAQGSMDAITGNQLYLMSNQLAAYFGGGAKYENGKWINPEFKVMQYYANGNAIEKPYTNVADAFGGVNNSMLNISNRIDQIEDKVDTDALKWNEEKDAYDASHNGQPSKIINVANGKIAKDSTDAVNGGQLWQTNERISGVEKDIKHIENRVDNISNTIGDIGDTVTNIENKVDNIEATVNNIADGVVSYDKDENGKKTNKVTLAGGNESEPVMIDNLADGKIEKGSKEAVNGGQLHDYTKEQMEIVLDQSKHYTDQRVRNIVVDAIDDAVDQANHYTDMKFEALNYTIEGVRKEARQAAAIGLAVSNLRYNDTPGKLSIAFGSGLWRNQSAFALGAGYSSENGKIRSNLSVTSSGGHWGVGAGFNMTLN